MPRRRLFIVLILLAAMVVDAGFITRAIDLYETTGAMSVAALVSIILAALAIVVLGGAAILVAVKKE
jgi:hypothetical protein